MESGGKSPSRELVEYITEKRQSAQPEGGKGSRYHLSLGIFPGWGAGHRHSGVGSVYCHNTEVAYNYLPQVDAAIFVVTVDPPLSAAEQEFLKDIREYVHKLFFVLNKVDYVDEAQRQEALEFTTQVLQANLAPERVMIFPLWAKLALAGKVEGRKLNSWGKPVYSRGLKIICVRFLYKEKGRVLLISCISGAFKAITDSTLALKVERPASSMPLRELEEKITRFDQEMQGLEKERELSLLLLEGRIKGVINEGEADLEAFKQETIIKLRPEVEEAFHQKGQAAGDFRQETEASLFHALRDVFTTWRQRKSKNSPRNWPIPTRISPSASMPSWSG